MPLVRRLIGLVVGVSAALLVTASSAAPPVPSLEGTWLVRAGEGQTALLLTCGADGTIAITVPDGRLALADGAVWVVAPAGTGTWRSRAFPEAEISAVFVSTGPKNAAPVLRLGVRVTMAATGQGWTGMARWEPLDGSGHPVTMEAVDTLTATRVLYGR